ncbi:MAG: hypothetical protein ACFFB0_15310 [Promethearchaeota archaeon]
MELTEKQFDEQLEIENFKNQLKLKKLKIIVGENDKLTTITEINRVFQNAKINFELSVIKGADHDLYNEEELEKANKELINYFM